MSEYDITFNLTKNYGTLFITCYKPLKSIEKQMHILYTYKIRLKKDNPLLIMNILFISA